MVVFVDLEDDAPDDPHADLNEPPRFSLRSLRKHHLGDKVTAIVTANSDDDTINERPNPNINSFSAALGAYPYVRPPSPPLHISTDLLTMSSNPASSPR